MGEVLRRVAVQNLNPLLHLRHLRRLWGIPTSNDHIQDFAGHIQHSVEHIRNESVAISHKQDALKNDQAAYVESVQEQFILSLRRLAIIEAKVDAVAKDSPQVDRQFDQLREELGKLVRASSEQITASITSSITPVSEQLNATLQALERNRDRDDDDDLSGERATLLNFAESHRGYRAKFDLWLNEPVGVRYEENRVSWSTTNERVVEVPFAFQAISDLPRDARILDIGACESTISVSLASIGYRVTALDVRNYPLSHPRLQTVRGNASDWNSGDKFDAALLVSTIEHIGLGAYGAENADLDGDRKCLATIRKLLKPGGRLVLTTPFGRSQRSELQRTYSAEDLTRLLEGFDITACAVAFRLDDRTWDTKWDVEFSELKYVDGNRGMVVLISGNVSGKG